VGRIVKVRAFRPDGTPLLADIAEDEAEGYRRNLIGFGVRHGDLDRESNERPLASVDLGDAQGFELEIEEEEGEEDE
jgi:hypothetical protein